MLLSQSILIRLLWSRTRWKGDWIIFPMTSILWKLNIDGVIKIPARCQIGLYFNFDCLYLSCFSPDFEKKKWFRKHKILPFQQVLNNRSVMKIFDFFFKKILKNDDLTHKISCIAIVFFLINCLFVGWKRTINSAFNAIKNMKIGQGIPEYWMKVCFYTMGSRTSTPLDLELDFLNLN